MISGGAELLAGVVQDPVFGPLVAFGPGGVFAELIGEAAFGSHRSRPGRRRADSSGKTGQLVKAFRGRPPSDAIALADLLHRLSRLADDLHSVAELDLNPVIGLTLGVRGRRCACPSRPDGSEPANQDVVAVLRLSELLGRRVVDAEGRAIGRITDVVMRARAASESGTTTEYKQRRRAVMDVDWGEVADVNLAGVHVRAGAGCSRDLGR